MSYFKYCFSSLKDIALLKLAIVSCLNCQGLKTTILCYPKSSYFEFSSTFNTGENLDSETKWVKIIEIQANILYDVIRLPVLWPKLLTCIRQIAFQWISWAKQNKDMFGLSMEFCSNFIVPEDWNMNGELNTKNVAERLVKDQSITICQRYRIACTYFLESFICDLWEKLSDSQKISFCPSESNYENDLVQRWSLRMLRRTEMSAFDEADLWKDMLKRSVEMGMIEGVSYCLNKVRYNEVKISSEKAFEVLEMCTYWKNRTCIINFNDPQNSWFPPTLQYRNILCFLITSMCEEEHISFFKEAFNEDEYSSVLECFLEWPYQEVFLPTITLIWDFLPEDVYANLLTHLIHMYSNVSRHKNYHTFNQDCEFKILFERLWEQTPTRFKRYIFSEETNCMGKDFLLEVLLKKSFNKDSIELITVILNPATKEAKQEMLEYILKAIDGKENAEFLRLALNICMHN